jgi:tripartite-type tricarboxylate transporter receptor subunit TctC
MMQQRLAASIIAAVAIAGVPTAADAQELPPGKPIRVILAVGVGGTSDIFMRVLGDEYHRRYGHPFVIENRAGGNGNIGARACAEAANDGSALCHLPNAALVYNEFLFKKLPYDPEALAPITNPFINTQLMVVSTALGVKTLAELAALSRAKPGTLSYTMPSAPLSVFMDWWVAKSGADMVRVPFKGGGDSANILLSGAVPVAMFGIGNWLPYIAAGTVRAIAVDSERRSALLPEVPTLRELGYTGDLTYTYFGLMAPPGTPSAIVDKFYENIAAIGRDSEFRRKRIIDMGLEPVFNTPAEFGRFIKEDRARAARIVKAAGLEP